MYDISQSLTSKMTIIQVVGKMFQRGYSCPVNVIKLILQMCTSTPQLVYQNFALYLYYISII